MLVITRKDRETIHIGDDIVIKIVSRRGSSIKVGIEAPAHVRVLRGELYEAAKSEQHLDAAS